MRRLKILAWWAAVLSFFGCGGAKPNKSEAAATKSDRLISMKFMGREVSWEPTYATFTTFRKELILKDSDIHSKQDRTPGVVHRIYLANYDLQLSDTRKQDYRRIAADAQYRVEIMLEAEEGALENAPVRVGDYAYKPEAFNRISYVFLSYFKEGKDSSENLAPKEFTGAIRITSVTEGEIKGEIDVSDNKESVKGKFTAQRLNP